MNQSLSKKPYGELEDLEWLVQVLLVLCTEFGHLGGAMKVSW